MLRDHQQRRSSLQAWVASLRNTAHRGPAHILRMWCLIGPHQSPLFCQHYCNRCGCLVYMDFVPVSLSGDAMTDRHQPPEPGRAVCAARSAEASALPYCSNGRETAQGFWASCRCRGGRVNQREIAVDFRLPLSVNMTGLGRHTRVRRPARAKIFDHSCRAHPLSVGANSLGLEELEKVVKNPARRPRVDGLESVVIEINASCCHAGESSAMRSTSPRIRNRDTSG